MSWDDPSILRSIEELNRYVFIVGARARFRSCASALGSQTGFEDYPNRIDLRIVANDPARTLATGEGAMIRESRWLIPMVVALALLSASASAVHAQVCYQPAPVVAVAPAVSYYAPAPAVSYYAPAPVVSYYAPAPVVSYYAAPAPVFTTYYAAPAAVTTYRYGPFGRLRSVRSYYYP
jgi:hypothetical protein